MLVLFMEAVCLVGDDMDGNAARNGPVELCRHGSVALYSLDFRPKPSGSGASRPKMEDCRSGAGYLFDRRGHRYPNAPARLQK